jgi:fatty-acyl-CoA synthase
VVGDVGIDWCVAAIGAITAGAVLFPLNRRGADPELAHMISDSGAKVVVAGVPYLERVRALALDQGVGVLEMSELCVADKTLIPPRVRRTLDDPVAVAYTSGTTGHPKGAVYTHGSLLFAFFEWMLQNPGFGPGCRILNVADFGFTAGLTSGLLAPVVLGGSCVQLPVWNATTALGLLESKQITVMAVPTIFFEQIAQEPAFGNTDLTSVKIALTGGAPVSISLLRKWQERGVVLRQGYGLTESGSGVTYPTDELAVQLPDVVGVGGILTRVRVVDESGHDCAPGEPGEFIVSGPGVARGYWQASELTDEVFRDGWLHTGDVGTIDEEGRMRVVGRLKDMIISGGMNIYAAEIERVILELDDVVEVAVIGVPDEKYGETPAALVRTSSPMAAQDIRAHCRRFLASYKLPTYVEFLDEALPRSTTNKVAKAQLREAYAGLPQRSKMLR